MLYVYIFREDLTIYLLKKIITGTVLRYVNGMLEVEHYILGWQPLSQMWQRI